jgi:uncharacterized protein
MTITPSVLITGASSGIGAVYADRFAQRGYNLVLVARDRARLEKLADRLRNDTGNDTGVNVDILQADLTNARGLALVETRLRDDSRIGILVNNAGMSAAGGFLDQSEELVDAALAGFDRREAVTIPSLPNPDQWTDLDTARKAMIPNVNQVHAAERYRRLWRHSA